MSGRIPPTICFGGNYYSISTLRTYSCIDGALIMPRSYYSSGTYSGYRPKTTGGTLLWASSGISPDFSRKFCELTILCLVCSGSHTVSVIAGIRLCHAGGGFTLTASLMRSGYATIPTNMDGPTLCFRATTFVVLGRFYQ